MATEQCMYPTKKAGWPSREGIARQESLGWVRRVGLQSPSSALVQVACILSPSASLSVKWADVAGI